MFKKNNEYRNLIENAEIIFLDFDGVIKESIKAKGDAFVAMIPNCSQEIQNKIKLHHESNGGISRFEKIPIYLKWAGLISNNENIKKYENIFSNIVIQKVIDSSWVPGVIEFLEKYSKIKKILLLSATPNNELNYIVDKLDIKKYFIDCLGTPMTKTNSIKYYLSSCYVEPYRAVLIGDSLSDFKAANDSDILFIYRKSGKNQLNKNDYFKFFINNFYDLL